MHQPERRVIRLFIASPSDVADERSVARLVVSDLNALMGDELGILVEPYGWEDEAPGVGRPQSLINTKVDACDLFLGILWKRWGQPSGEADSGFHEEYSRAWQRHSDTGQPAIWLAFKHVDPDAQSDPGRQLQKVLEFKADIIASKKLLFSEFAEVIEFERRFRQWLTAFLFRSRSQPTKQEGRARPSTRRPRSTGAPPPSPTAIPSELLKSSSNIRGALTKDRFGAYLQQSLALSRFDLLRLTLQLQSWTWFSYGAQTVGPHELNALYQDRSRITLILPEHFLVLITLLSDRYDTLPGWYWFRSDPDALEHIFRALLNERDTERRGTAIKVLEQHSVVVAVDELNQLVAAIEADDEPAGLVALLSYAGAVGGEEYLPVLERLGGRPELESALAAAQCRIRLRHGVRTSELIAQTERYAPNDLIEIVRHNPVSLGTACLLQLSHSANSEIKKATVSVLARSEVLTVGDLYSLLEDADGEIRRTGCAALLRRGESLPMERIRILIKQGAPRGLPLGSENIDADILLAGYRELTRGELEQSIEWLNPEGPIAYRALGSKHFAEVAGRIRLDVADQFASLEQSHKDKSRRQIMGMAPQAPPEIIEALESEVRTHLDKVSELSEFLRSRYVDAAFLVLAEHGGQVDAHAARQRLQKTDYDPKSGAIRLLARYGDPEDAALLLAVATHCYGSERAEALQAATKLAPGISGVGPSLLMSDHRDFVVAGLQALEQAPIAEARPLVDGLLNSKSDDIRVAAAAFLVNKLTTDELEALAVEYGRRNYYYYNVGVWIDRVLYAPEPLRAGFRRKLASFIER